MDENTKKMIEKIKSKIENATYDELKDIIIEEGNFGIYGKEDKTIYTVPGEYYYDLYYTLNETKQLRSIKNRSEDDEAIELGSSNYKRVSKDVLEKFSPRVETPEERAKRLKFESKRRKAKRKYEKRKIRSAIQKSKNSNTFNKAKNKNGKKIMQIIAAIGLSAVAITGAVQGISKAYADSKDYDYVASTVENLNEDEIAKKAEIMLKEEISKATGENIENISFLDDWRGSSLHFAQIKAGNQEYRYIDDLRGGDVFGENTMSKNLFKLVLEMNNAKGKGRREVIEALKNSMNFSKNKDIKVKDGKLVEIEESTRDSVNSNEIETDKVNTEKDGEER